MKKSAYNVFIFAGICFAQTDTIAELNNPTNLDMSRHQLFIDTTKKSNFHSRIIKYSSSLACSQCPDTKSNSIVFDGNEIEINLIGFSRYWVTVRKYEDKYYLYDRCNGEDQRFAFMNSKFSIYGPMEDESLEIHKIISNEKEQLIVELSYYGGQTTTATLTKSERKNIYTIEIFGYQVDAVPFEAIDDFDVVVNHCPTGRTSEFPGFD